MIYTGCVESRMDPLMLGRCQVRIVGIHTHDKTELPTEDLPWAHPMGPITSASISGLGWSPTGIVPGTWVVVTFLDEYHQQPLILGTIGGIPQTQSAFLVGDATDSVISVDNTGELMSSNGGDSITDMIDSIGRAESVFDQQPLEETEKYSVVPDFVETSEGLKTNIKIFNKNGSFNAASGYYDEALGMYMVNLDNADTWTSEQVRPFRDGPMQFQTTQDIVNYFETNY